MIQVSKKNKKKRLLNLVYNKVLPIKERSVKRLRIN